MRRALVLLRRRPALVLCLLGVVVALTIGATGITFAFAKDTPPAAVTAAASVGGASVEKQTPVLIEEPKPQEPVFQSRVTPIGPGLKDQLLATGMWSSEAPMPLEELRVIHVSYWGFDGAVHEGKMIVNQAWATQLVGVFEKIFDARFPIYRMDPVDYLAKSGSGLEASSNTMSFNARNMRGGNKWSQHAYGLAIDINTGLNPYIKGDTIIPEIGRDYIDRTLDAPGMIKKDDAVVKAFAEIGWKWGGDWNSHKDYMHFSANGK